MAEINDRLRCVLIHKPEGKEENEAFDVLLSRVPTEGEGITIGDLKFIVNFVQHQADAPLSEKKNLHAAFLYCWPYKRGGK